MKKFTSIFVFLLMVSCQIALAQTRQVSGTVVSSEDNSPIAGVTVFVKGTNAGTVTDDQGRFMVNVPAGATVLEFSFVGYRSAELSITGNTVNARLDPEALDVDDVVVIAYGTARKSSLTGATASIDSKKLENRPLTNALGGLEGAAPGVLVNNSYGAADSEPTIRIRGIGSINASSSPLYVVDGVPFDGGLSSINPADIDNITVLKDASSTALYGSRAANGVIMVTTKTGRPERSTFRVTINQGFTQRGIKEYDLMGINDYMSFAWDSYRNGLVSSGNYTTDQANDLANTGLISNVLRYNIFNVADDQLFINNDGTLNPNASVLPGYLGDFDWYKDMERLGYRQDYNISASGGSNKSNYYMSMGYVNQRDYIVKSGMERFNGRVNVNVTPTSWLKAGLNISGSVRNNNFLSADGDYTSSYVNPFYYARSMGPIYPVHLHDATTGEYILDENGNKIYDLGIGYADYGVPTRPQFQGRHVIFEIENDMKRNRYTNLVAQPHVEVLFLNGFKFRVNASLESTNRWYKAYNNTTIGDGAPAGRATRQSTNTTIYNFNQLLTYNRSFGDHSIDVLVGHENYDYVYNYLTGQRSGQILEGNDELRNFTDAQSVDSYTNKLRREGYLSRVMYNYKNRYFFDASYRRDGSSKFYKDVRWGNFWSAGASWMISSENFMAGVNWLNILKLRASYGEVGNDSGIGTYAWQPLYSILSGGNAGTPAQVRSSLGNRNLEWETNSTFDVAVEFRMFNRWNGSIEFFHRQSSNLLFNVALPASTGGTAQGSSTNPAPFTSNIGTMWNRGIEVAFDVDAIRSSQVTWNIGLNLTHYKNKITKLPEENRELGLITGNKKYTEGHGIYDYWVRDWYGVNSTNGDPLYILDEEENTYDTSLGDIELNGLRLTNDYERARFSFHGSAIPDLYGSLTNSLSWKNFDLNVLLTFQLGGKIYDSSYASLMSASIGGSSKHKDLVNRWRKPGDVTDIPRADNTTSADMSGGYNSRWLVNGSYLNFKSVTLGYTFPKNITDKMYIGSLRVNASVENIGYLSKRKGMSPQQSFAGGSSSQFVQSRIFTFGLNFTL